jgi:hypothetical protein
MILPSSRATVEETDRGQNALKRRGGTYLTDKYVNRACQVIYIRCMLNRYMFPGTTFRLRWAVHILHTREMRSANKILGINDDGMR